MDDEGATTSAARPIASLRLASPAFAPSLGLELRPVDLREAGEIERSINAFAQSSNGGLIVTGSPAATAHRDLIVSLAARNRLPAVY
jgi:putative ABC transport system substrate-binding protein